MDKQGRLSAIMISIKEYNEKMESAIYGAKLAIESREYGHLKYCAEKLIAAENEIELLNREAKS